MWGIDGWGTPDNPIFFFAALSLSLTLAGGFGEILDPYFLIQELAVLKALDEEVGRDRTCRPSGWLFIPLPRSQMLPWVGWGLEGEKPQRPLSSYLLAEAWGAPGNRALVVAFPAKSF